MNKKPLRLAVLLSGSGTTMDNIQRHIESGSLNCKIVQVISSRSNVKGVDKAKGLGLEPVILRRKDYETIEGFSEAVADEISSAQADLVVQAGWLCLWRIPEDYTNKVMNIHPALLPSFGGKGMWGENAHKAVLEAGCKISGCTVHFCTNEYDKGPIIVQRSCPAYYNDTPETLASRVFELECRAYPEAISLFEQGKLRLRGGIVEVIR